MKSLWFYYLRSFKDIASHGAIFTTLILSVLFYSFFYTKIIAKIYIFKYINRVSANYSKTNKTK